MKRFFLFFLLSFLFVSPTFAQEIQATIVDVQDTFIRLEDKAGERYTIQPSVETSIQQELREGHNVTIQALDPDAEEPQYIITGFVRAPWLLFLFFLFAACLWIVNGKRGWKSLVNLFVTVGIIFFAIAPAILKGWNPIAVTIVGGALAMLWSIYFSSGINRKSHAAVVSIAISLFTVGILSSLFVSWASLTGFTSEEATFLNIMNGSIDIRGLLLAGIIIGALGVLDDLTISQVSLVKELLAANPNMHTTALFKAAHRVGHDHTSAVVNTLVLAYTGAAFPLVMLFAIGEPPFDSMSGILNNELVATEIVRTLVGSIAILLSMPISTWIAIRFFRGKELDEDDCADGCCAH